MMARFAAEKALFPAHAGMNRDIEREIEYAGSVPRPRGDEPAMADAYAAAMLCSPPTRG